MTRRPCRWRPGDPVLTTSEAATRLGITRPEVFDLAIAGLLDPVTLGITYYVTAASVDAHRRRRQTYPTPTRRDRI